MSKGKNRDEIDELRLSRSQLEVLIFEANLGLRDTTVAQMRYIDQMPLVDIAGEMSDMLHREINRQTVAQWAEPIKKKLLEAWDEIAMKERMGN